MSACQNELSFLVLFICLGIYWLVVSSVTLLAVDLFICLFSCIFTYSLTCEGAGIRQSV